MFRIAAVVAISMFVSLYGGGFLTDDGPVPVADGPEGIRASISKARFVAACSPSMPRTSCNCLYPQVLQHLSEVEIDYWLARTSGRKSKARRLSQSDAFDERRFGRRLLNVMMDSRPCLENEAEKIRARKSRS